MLRAVKSMLAERLKEPGFASWFFFAIAAIVVGLFFGTAKVSAMALLLVIWWSLNLVLFLPKSLRNMADHLVDDEDEPEKPDAPVT